MVKFLQNDCGKCVIINKMMILTKQFTDKTHADIQKKYWKYPSTTILKQVNVLDKENKFPYECFHITLTILRYTYIQ